MQQQPDWFEYLKLAPDAPAEQVEQAVERLSRQAAALAVTAPERSQQLRDTVRAIKRDLLSGAENRARYDAARAAAPAAPGAPPAVSPIGPPAPAAPSGTEVPPLPPTAPWSAMPPPPPPGPFTPGPVAGGPGTGGPGQALGGLEAFGSRVARFLRTGWTCSACGKEAMPSDKFCTKCGTAITPIRHEAPARPTPRATCANCNTALGANDAFCARCGTPVEK